jgi:hypothetical protein
MYVMSLALEGMKAKNMSNTKMPIGSRSNMKGGGGNGGSTKGRINKDAVRHTSKSNDTKLKWLAVNNLLLLPCERDRLYSIFLFSTLVLGGVARGLLVVIFLALTSIMLLEQRSCRLILLLGTLVSDSECSKLILTSKIPSTPDKIIFFQVES